MFRRMFLVCLLTLLGSPTLPEPNRAEETQYTVTDLGTLGGAWSEAFGLNGSGLVVGRSETAAGKQHAFLYYPHGYRIRANGQLIPDLQGKPVLVDLTPGWSGNSEARALNSFDIAAGTLFSATGQPEAVVWNGRSAERLQGEGAYALNDRGQVGGQNRLWQIGTKETTLVAPFVCDTLFQVYGISDTGEAIGAELFDTTHGTSRPFVRREGKCLLLTQPASKGVTAAAYAINNTGQVVGTNGKQAFLWQAGKLTWLSEASVRFSVAYAINDQGHVVGQADVSLRDESLRAVLWEKGRMINLNTRIEAASGWTLLEARGINARGQICGTGLIAGKRHAFLLTPISPTPPP
jgi:probable HAF family extracellular repeat protein